jgi:hypothetical protein
MSFAVSADAQTKPRKPVPKKNTAAQVDPPASEIPSVKTPGKKNERPNIPSNSSENANTSAKSDPAEGKSTATPVYFYEFTNPAFVISQLRIEFDENGTGQISFMKKNYDELITDPIQLSNSSLTKIKDAFEALRFLESDENYQYEKDYSHLGNIKIKVKKEGRERETKFNYTSNLKAKALADEFRKIGQQFVWIFDINVARENQPLESPKLIDALDSMVRRNEVSDASQMIPFLKKLSDDERIPLISRNHTAKLIKQIEKAAEKNQ